MNSSMASPESVCYEKMEEDLTCPVCLELYADPLMMTCSHSICKTCLNDIKVAREKLGKTDFDCPTCRDTHPIRPDLLEKLPKNLALENIVFRFQEIKSTSMSRSEGLFDQSFSSAVDVTMKETDDNDDVFDESLMDSHCGMCDDNQHKKAEWFCPQCDVLYCQSCLNTFHPRKGSLGRHKVCKPMQRKVVKTNTLYCAEHTSETASIFCDTCKTVACHLCVCQGQGSHGHHVILDLNTAKEKMQTTFSKATEDLSVLISAFGLRDKEMDSQLETIKSLHDSAQTQITSQFQCFMSDAAATLQLAKEKFHNTIVTSSTQHALPVETRSKQIKSALNRCLTLMERCNSFVNNHRANTTNYANQKGSKMLPPHKDRHLRARSLPQPFILQGGQYISSTSNNNNNNLSLSSSEDSPNSSSATEYRKPTKTKPRSRRSLSLLDQKEATASQIPTTQEFVNKLPPAVKSQEELFLESNKFVDLSTSSSSSSARKKDMNMNRALMTSTPIPHGERKVNRSPVSMKCDVEGAVGGMSVSSTTTSNETTGASDKISPRRNDDSNNNNNEDKEKKENNNNSKQWTDRVREQMQKTTDQQTLSTEDSRKRLKSRTSDMQTAVEGRSLSPSCQQELRQEDLMLVQAREIEDILEEIAHLAKELDLAVVGNEEDLLSEITRDLSSSLSSFNEVAATLLSYLTTDTIQSVSDIPIMMPAVRSVASPLSPGQKGAPRVQSRTLITWGFNSTSFTAEPVDWRGGQWSVSITRNTSHIGDLKTGYLFGVGVARQSLTSKEQVGMNPYSYGIICSSGVLAFCHDGHVTPITLLSDLPLSIRLAVSSGHLGIVLSYWITPPGALGATQGRRVIALHGKRRKTLDGGDDNDGDGGCCSDTGGGGGEVVECSSSTPDRAGLNVNNNVVDSCINHSVPTPTPTPMLPVFTVSQRVKMTFPLNSDE